MKTDAGYVLAVDLGTTNIKLGLFDIKELKLRAFRTEKISIDVDGDEAVQDPDEWWDVICEAVPKLLSECSLSASSVTAMSFCSQAGSFIPVDRYGEPLFGSLNCIDGRGFEEYKGMMGSGFRIQGVNLELILASIPENKAGPVSHKDIVWKYRWFKKNMPELYSRMYKALDVNGYLLMKCTGRFVTSYDSGFVYMIVNTKTREWSRKLCKIYDIDPNHLPDLVLSTTKVGNLTDDAAVRMGLTADVEVYAGGGDMSLIQLGSGAVRYNERHIYGGSSAWVGVATENQIFDITSMMTACPGAFERFHNYIGELEIAGTSLEWMIRKILDVDFSVLDSPDGLSVPGSNGVLFTPWINGIRAPKQNGGVSGSFLNISLSTTRWDMCRAVIEGICLHLKWICNSADWKTEVVQEAYFVGGMSKSDLVCQIMSDILGYTIYVPENPQQAGLTGAALCAVAGKMRISDVSRLKDYIRIERVFYPNEANRAVYDKCYLRFLDAYSAQK